MFGCVCVRVRVCAYVCVVSDPLPPRQNTGAKNWSTGQEREEERESTEQT